MLMQARGPTTTYPDGIDLPLALLPSNVHIATEYFTGPWLPRSSTNQYLAFLDSVDRPLGVFDDSVRAERLRDAWYSILPQEEQLSFLSTSPTLKDRLEAVATMGRDSRYWHRFFTIRSKNKKRDIQVPHEALQALQREYVLPLVRTLPVHPAAHGGEPGWSPSRSLASHTSQGPIGAAFSFDLRNAFANTHSQYVFDTFYRNLRDHLGDTEVARDLSGTLTALSTVVRDGIDALGQGSPISMAVFNRVLEPVDALLARVAGSRGLHYSRWVDDFILTSTRKFTTPRRFVGATRLVREDFPLSANKVVFQPHQPAFYLLGHVIEGTEACPSPIMPDTIERQIVELSGISTPYEQEQYGLDDDEDWLPSEFEGDSDSFL